MLCTQASRSGRKLLQLSIHQRRRVRTSAASVETDASVRQPQDDVITTLKEELRSLIRMSNWDSDTRARIGELQVAIEGYGTDIDFDKLEGLWRLLYTTAADVAPLMADMRGKGIQFPLKPSVSAVFQRFTSREEGIVQNIIQAGDGLFLEAKRGVTFIVNANFKQSLPKTIELTFESAQVCGLQPANTLEALIAPAVLPRTSLQHQALLAFQEFQVKVPLPTPSRLSGSDSRATGKYMLSYCDDDLLIGRAQTAGGVFMFERDNNALLPF